MDDIANLEFKRVIPREPLRPSKGAEFVYNVDHGGFVWVIVRIKEEKN